MKDIPPIKEITPMKDITRSKRFTYMNDTEWSDTEKAAEKLALTVSEHIRLTMREKNKEVLEEDAD